MNFKHKFHAKHTVIDDKHFPSKMEANYYRKLKLAQLSGKLVFFLRQVPFDLPGNVKYFVDFVEFWDSGEVIFTDVKGYFTPLSKLKIEQVEDIYPIKINIVTKT